jgi:hypothetical protein
MTQVEQTVIDALKAQKVEFDPSKVHESTSGRIVELPDPLIKLIRQEDHWSIFDCGKGAYVGGGDSLDECIEALYG